MPSNVVTPGSPPAYPVHGGKASRLRRAAGAYNRRAHRLSTPPTEGLRGDRKTEDTELSSRKVVWLEKVTRCLKKIKHRFVIAFNSMRLQCHFYTDPETRKELKQSISASKIELGILDGEQKRKKNIEQMREEFQDGRYAKAAGHVLEAGCHGVSEAVLKLQKHIIGDQ